GDVTQGFAYDLAPYVDVNLNGEYDPENGDFPCIKGDRAIYLIMNDKGDVHQSGGAALGIEVHYMFYQYESSDDINNTTFCNMRIINRGTETFSDFHTGVFLDSDLGGYNDDYVGSSESKKLMFAYNGDDNDQDVSGNVGYGTNPPAIGVMSLNHALVNVRSFSSSNTGITGMGNTPADYWNVLTGNYLDGTPVADLFSFSDLPSSTTGDSEFALSNPPGDRRMTYSIDLGGFNPGDVKELDYAVIYNRNVNGTAVSNADGLLDVADNVQAFYDNLSNACEAEDLVGVDVLSLDDIEVYPNPSVGTFYLQSKEDVIGSTFSVLDISGRAIVASKEIKSIIEEVSIQGASGVYFLTINNGTNVLTKKLIVE
ncbi:MAG: T9SS type A sorting domain-containing protein, partial [Crocinitomicaceae bacterium]|nr:T9SS type A sorting domain-containing protein [Crocinitomicaceae bacterium]